MESIWWAVIIGTVVVSSAAVLGVLWWGVHWKDGLDGSRYDDFE